MGKLGQPTIRHITSRLQSHVIIKLWSKINLSLYSVWFIGKAKMASTRRDLFLSTAHKMDECLYDEETDLAVCVQAVESMVLLWVQ